MRRTARLATIPLNTNKIAYIRNLERTYADAKDRFLLALAPTTMWHHLSNKRSFRDWAKVNDLYPAGVNVHLLDQAAFDAVDTWVRHIESVIAISRLKAKIYCRFKNDARHYAYSVLKSYTDIGMLLRREVPERTKIPVSVKERE